MTQWVGGFSPRIGGTWQRAAKYIATKEGAPDRIEHEPGAGVAAGAATTAPCPPNKQRGGVVPEVLSRLNHWSALTGGKVMAVAEMVVVLGMVDGDGADLVVGGRGRQGSPGIEFLVLYCSCRHGIN